MLLSHEFAILTVKEIQIIINVIDELKGAKNDQEIQDLLYDLREAVDRSNHYHEYLRDFNPDRYEEKERYGY